MVDDSGATTQTLAANLLIVQLNGNSTVRTPARLQSLVGLISIFICSFGPPPDSHAADPATAPADTQPISSGVPLRILNREIFVFRSQLGAYHPEQRAAAATTLFEQARKRSDGTNVDTIVVETNIAVRLNGHTVFFITPGDVSDRAGESLELLTEQTARKLKQAVQELEELRDHRNWVAAGSRAIAATLITAGLIWLLSRNRRWVESRLIRLTAEQADQIKSHTLRMLGLQNVVPLLRGLLTFLFWLLLALIGAIWLEYLLRLFPHTRPFGEQLGNHFLQLLESFGTGIVHAIPNLGIVVCVWLVARFINAAIRRYFAGVTRGTIKSHVFDPATAQMTRRICVVAIWVIAVIVAFPYIPGSQTPAFQGVSVLAGLMITVGSGNLIAQLVGGMVAVYNRNCRVGDYVRVGDQEGTLTTIGFFSSRLITARREEVVIPNSQLSSGVLINYSKLNETEGVALPVKVSIGYNTPWRQVHALLLAAAAQTEGVRKEPPPVVLQNSLADFYIEYQLNAILAEPDQRVKVLSRLNANIQDAFNEAGVQIMSPHYRCDPAQPVFVPKDKWYLPPARSEHDINQSPPSEQDEKSG